MWWTLLVMYVIGVIWRALYLALSDRARRRIKECALNLRYWLLLLLEPVRFVDLIHLKFIWLRPWSLRHALYMMTHSWGCSPGSEFSGGWFDMGLMSFHYRRPK